MTEITPKLSHIVPILHNNVIFQLDGNSLYYLSEKLLYPDIRTIKIVGNKIYTTNTGTNYDVVGKLNYLIRFATQTYYHTFVLEVPACDKYGQEILFSSKNRLIIEKALTLLNLKYKRILNTEYNYEITKRVFPIFELSEYRSWDYLYETYLKNENTDLTLMSNTGKNFHIHSIVIQQAKIPYFVALQNFRKEQDNKVYKLDYCSEVLNSFIDYLYWGNRKWVENYKKSQYREIEHRSVKYEKYEYFEDLILFCDYINYDEFFNVLSSLHPKRVIHMNVFQESQVNNKYFQDISKVKILTLENHLTERLDLAELWFKESLELTSLTITNPEFNSKIPGHSEDNIYTFRYKLDIESKVVVYLFYRDNPFYQNQLNVIVYQDRKCIGLEHAKFKEFLDKVNPTIVINRIQGYIYENFLINNVLAKSTITYHPNYFYNNKELRALEERIYFIKPIENLTFLTAIISFETINGARVKVNYYHYRASNEQFNLYLRISVQSRIMVHFIAFQSKTGNKFSNKPLLKYLRDYFPSECIYIMDGNYVSNEKAYLKKHGILNMYERNKKIENEEINTL